MPPVTAVTRPSGNASTSSPTSNPPRRARKAFAYRSPSSSSSSSSSSSATSSSSSTPSSQGHRYSPYPAPPEPVFLFTLLNSSTPVETEYILAPSNNRYPGAPGTALYKVREASEKAAHIAQREADKKRRAKEELARMGVDEKLGPKRSRDSAKRSESPYTTTATATTAPANAPSRRRARGAAAAAKEDGGTSVSSRSSSVARSAAIKESSNNLLAVPSTSGLATSTSSNGRLRKPASRSNSPVPLTAAQPAKRRSPDRAQNGDNASNAGPGASPAASSSAGGSSIQTPTPAAASTVARMGVASAVPFQSSPLARDSVSFKTFSAEEGDESAPSAHRGVGVVAAAAAPRSASGSLHATRSGDAATAGARGATPSAGGPASASRSRIAGASQFIATHS